MQANVKGPVRSRRIIRRRLMMMSPRPSLWPVVIEQAPCDCTSPYGSAPTAPEPRPVETVIARNP
jgi:hypothetical protein